MNEAQWQEAWDIYAAAADLSGEAKRAYLASLSTDPEILDEVISMLEEAQGAGLEPTDRPSRTGTSFGRYHVGEIVSSGGMGEVYSAVDPELGRKVALKFLNPEAASSRRAVEQLIREAKAASALNHPHIITVYEVIRAQDDVAIAMELVEGQSLRKFCGKPAEIGQVIQWGRQIAQALAAAHQSNIIHRDIKPENLMVRDDGFVKVLDFGLAGSSGYKGQPKSTETTGLGGTLNYMSPEQTGGERATSASDVFSLGLVLYELASGVHPFRSDSPIDTAYAIAHAEPKPLSSINRSISASIEAIVLKMLSKDPQQRPSAQQVNEQLAFAAQDKPVRRYAAFAWVAVLIAIAGALSYAYRDTGGSKKDPQFVQLTRQVNENRVIAAALSPDGSTLLFATFSGPVYSRRMTDGNIRPLETLKGLRIDRMVWFQDGSRVLVNGWTTRNLDANGPAIWVMAAEGGKLEQVAKGAKNGVPSPDGSQLAFTSADGSSLFVASLTSGQRRQIRSGGKTTTFSSLVWSPDGKRIAFQRAEYTLPGELASDPSRSLTINRYQNNYESVDVETRQTVAAVNNFSMQSATTLRDGTLVFLRNSIEDTFTLHLWRQRIDPSTGQFLEKAQRITTADFQLSEISASVDGKQVVAIRRVNSYPNLYVADLPPARQSPRFQRVRRLTFTEVDEYPHSWTADSRSIIFESFRSGNFDLYRQDIEESDARPVMISKDASVIPHVTPDGKWILFNQKHGAVWSLMRVSVEGGAEETVVADALIHGDTTCSLGRVGRCVMRSAQGKEFHFWELDPLRGKGRELATTAWSPTVVGDWDISPDGSRVAIPNHDARDATIRVVPLDARGGTAERIVHIENTRNISGVVWAADGRGWYVSVWEGSRGLLLYVDLDGRVLTNLLESMKPTYAVPSPDGRRVAFMDWTMSSNVWQVNLQ